VSKYDMLASYTWSTATGDPRVEHLRHGLGLDVFVNMTELDEGQLAHGVKGRPCLCSFYGKVNVDGQAMNWGFLVTS